MRKAANFIPFLSLPVLLKAQLIAPNYKYASTLVGRTPGNSVRGINENANVFEASGMLSPLNGKQAEDIFLKIPNEKSALEYVVSLSFGMVLADACWYQPGRRARILQRLTSQELPKTMSQPSSS